MQERLDTIRTRIGEAVSRSGRHADNITLLAVSKTFPSPDITALADCGQVDFGENRVQELTSKMDEIGSGTSERPVRWHLIGHLQRNKVKEVIGRIHLFHALDSLRLARELNKRLDSASEFMDCLVQINVSGEASKFGLDPGQLPPFLDAIESFERIDIQGLMTLAHPSAEPEDVRPEFGLLRSLRDKYADRLGRGYLSMGMSGDFEVAIEEGATHVRVGSALFGSRG